MTLFQIAKFSCGSFELNQNKASMTLYIYVVQCIFSRAFAKLRNLSIRSKFSSLYFLLALIFSNITTIKPFLRKLLPEGVIYWIKFLCKAQAQRRVLLICFPNPQTQHRILLILNILHFGKAWLGYFGEGLVRLQKKLHCHHDSGAFFYVNS